MRERLQQKLQARLRVLKPAAPGFAVSVRLSDVEGAQANGRLWVVAVMDSLRSQDSFAKQN